MCDRFPILFSGGFATVIANRTEVWSRYAVDLADNGQDGDVCTRPYPI